MSNHAFERLLDLVLRPFLLSISDLFPGLFPSHWVLNPPFDKQGSLVANDRQTLKSLYMGMCFQISYVGTLQYRVHVDGVSSMDASGLVESIALGGERIYSRLLTRRRVIRGHRRDGFNLCTIRLLAQIEEIRGIDVAFHHLRTQLEDICCYRRPSQDPAGLCKFVCKVGLVQRMLRLATDFRDTCLLSNRGRSYLDDLIAALVAVVLKEQLIRLAVAMALHPRLGEFSSLSVLGADIIPLCVPRLIQKPVNSWSMVMME